MYIIYHFHEFQSMDSSTYLEIINNVDTSAYPRDIIAVNEGLAKNWLSEAVNGLNFTITTQLPSLTY
jgi:hypothetical protein